MLTWLEEYNVQISLPYYTNMRFNLVKSQFSTNGAGTGIGR